MNNKMKLSVLLQLNSHISRISSADLTDQFQLPLTKYEEICEFDITYANKV